MKVLVASKDRQVYEAIAQTQGVEAVSALNTGRIYAALPDCQVAIIDYGALVSHPFSRDLIRKLLDASDLVVCSSEEFLASPASYLEDKSLRKSTLAFPAKRTIAFTSYSGGTGKTSLALDTAMHFCRQTRKAIELPAAVFEFTYGCSAFQALLGDEQHSLGELMSQPQDLEPSEVNGVSLFPLNYGDMASFALPQVGEYMRRRTSHYVLTVVDTMWPHVYTSAIEGQVDLWVVVTTPRVDAVDNARQLRLELERDYGSDKVVLAINQGGGLFASLALMGTEREIELPRVKHSDIIYGGNLGKVILGHLYGDLWRGYERMNGRRGLFRR